MATNSTTDDRYIVSVLISGFDENLKDDCFYTFYFPTFADAKQACINDSNKRNIDIIDYTIVDTEPQNSCIDIGYDIDRQILWEN